MKEEFKPLTPYWYNIGDVVNDQEILEQTYAVDKNGWKHKAYIVKCLKCGYIYDHPKSENNLKKYHCEVCTGRKVVPGINDIATTAQWMIKYLKNPEDAQRYTYGSNEKVPMICPECKQYEKVMSLNTLYRNGFGCKFCSDGISYPEKFIANLLKQLEIDFIAQLSRCYFKWCDKYRYDFYILHKNIIIEVNGRQHYDNAFNKTSEDQKEIDKIKKDLAISNGIRNYVELDCRESTMEWIKQSIVDSGLQDILDVDFNDVDWDKIESDSLKSNVFIACELWNKNETFTTEDIGKILNLASVTILKYLKKGTKIGICDYTSEKGKKRRDMKKIGKVALNAKKIFYDGLVYDSLKIFSNSINKSETAVGKWVKGACFPRNIEDYIYLEAHYATEEEIAKYPRYKYDE